MQTETLPEVRSSTNLPALDVIAQLRAHRKHSFADYLDANWPDGVAQDCAGAAVGMDCIELKLPEEQYCECCQAYALICRAWYALPEIQQRLTA